MGPTGPTGPTGPRPMGPTGTFPRQSPGPSFEQPRQEMDEDNQSNLLLNTNYNRKSLISTNYRWTSKSKYQDSGYCTIKAI